jgi:hypothetical protein
MSPSNNATETSLHVTRHRPPNGTFKLCNMTWDHQCDLVPLCESGWHVTALHPQGM